MLYHKIINKLPIHLLVAASAWTSRIITALAQIICIRYLVMFLSIEDYAVFTLLSGLVGWFVLVDFGVGSSLQNYISEQRAKGLSYERFLSATSVIAFVILTLSVAFLLLVAPLISKFYFSQFPTNPHYDQIKLIVIFGILLIFTNIGNISFKVWYAEFRGYLSNIIPGVASLISVITIILLSRIEMDNKLIWSVIAYFFPLAFLSILICWKKLFKYASLDGFKDREYIRLIVKRGFKYWVFFLMGTITLQMDYLILSQFGSTQDIIIYNFITKVFLLIMMVYNALLMALWPVFTESITLNNWSKVISLLKRYMIFGLIIQICGIIFFIFFRDLIIKILAPGISLNIPISIIVFYGSYQFVKMFTDMFAMVLQSISYMKPFWIWVPIQAVVNFFMQTLLVPRYGLYGVIIGLTVSYLTTVTWVLPRKILQIYRAEQRKVLN